MYLKKYLIGVMYKAYRQEVYSKKTGKRIKNYRAKR